MADLIRQEIDIEGPPISIFKELLLWGESSWWPKSSLMRFKNLSGKIDSSTLYLQRVKFPFAPKWHTKNSEIRESDFYIKRDFLDGMFSGFEELQILNVDKQNKLVVCSFNYEVNGFLNKVLWNSLFKRLHIRNIDFILKRLKKFIEKK